MAIKLVEIRAKDKTWAKIRVYNIIQVKIAVPLLLIRAVLANLFLLIGKKILTRATVSKKSDWLNRKN